MRKLNLKACGGNYDLVKKTIKRLNLDISHMTGKGWNIGLKFIPNKAQPLSEILVVNSTFVNTYKLKKRLLKEGLKEHKCEICKQTEWLGKPIPLELHHVNGIKDATLTTIVSGFNKPDIAINMAATKKITTGAILVPISSVFDTKAPIVP